MKTTSIRSTSRPSRAPAATPSPPARPRPSCTPSCATPAIPFYTGKQKLVDTGGRVERFERRYGRRGKKSYRTSASASSVPSSSARWWLVIGGKRGFARRRFIPFPLAPGWSSAKADVVGSS